jgi:putative transposase
MTGYLIGILNNLDCPSITTGVVEDHVHILCNLSRSLSIASLVSQLKSSSSERIKSESKDVAAFYWQAGYGVFSVSQSNIERVVEYIANQEEHHRKVSFQDELRLLLNRHQIPFDERYVWD